MKKTLLFLSTLLWILLFSLFSACSDDDSSDDPDEGKTEAPAIIQKVNNFIYSYFDEAYLWTAEIPRNIDIRYQTNPFDFFDTLKYEPDDRWSHLTDDADAMFDDYEGVGTSFGYEFMLGEFSNTGNYFAIVLYIYPKSPAEEAGLKRGDIIVLMNHADITESNYKKLLNSPSIELTLGEWSEEGIRVKDQTLSMTAVKMNLDPVNTWKVIESGNHKIGYLCYTGYITNSHEDLVEVFTDFKSQGVTDVVLDLRYNLGGAAVTAAYLSSILAPAAAVSSKSIFLREIWNDAYMEYYKQKGEDVNQYFDPEIPVNMDLKRLFVLTTSNTASASEATIVGLSSYLDVIKIGTTTRGKYCGAALLQPWTDNAGHLDKDIANWAMSLIIYRFANRDGVTDFKNGFVPDYEIEDNLFQAYPFGDERDPLLAKALELITGNTPPATASLSVRSIPTNLRLLPDQEIRRSPLQGLLIDRRPIPVLQPK